MREIVLDTETTGLDPAAGHRIVEIGCIELYNHTPTGREFHSYLDPEREVPAEAAAIHGLTDEWLRGQPKFADVAQDFLSFIEDAPLVIHNAEFDVKFLNAELRFHGFDPLPMTRAVDTLLIAQQKFPGAQASLDALCRRFNIDLTERDKHGAIIDCRLLAAVYLELVGGRQPGLALAADDAEEIVTPEGGEQPRRAPRTGIPGAAPLDEERAAHEALLEKLQDPLWRA